jgi:malate dehydrogenase (oxaloacetate-decarboxylating)
MAKGLLYYQKPYARPAKESARWARTQVQVDLEEEARWPQMAALRAKAASGEGIVDLVTVVAHVHPTVLIGTSTKGGAFSQQVIQEVAKHVKRPMIFPISNPTERIEAVPSDILRWTDGRALVSTGLPWGPVVHKGTSYEIGQANNALIYPGIGLGTIVSRAARVTDNMLVAASKAVAEQVDVRRPGVGLVPDVENLRASSAAVAVAVVKQALEDGVATVEVADPVQAVEAAMWSARYADLPMEL